MLNLEIADDVDNKWWNGLVQSVPEGGVYQTTFWADYLKRSGCGKPYYLVFYDQEKSPLCILMICFEDKLHKKNIPLLIKKKFNFTYAGWLNGPLILKKQLTDTILEQIIHGIEEFCRGKNAIAVRNITLPLVYGEGENIYNDFDRILKKNFFTSYKFETAFIDLTLGSDKIWNSLKRDTRKDINRGSKNGFVLVELARDDLLKYENLIAENMSRNNMLMPPHYPNNIMWDSLRCNGVNFVRVLAVRNNDSLTGALGLLEFNGIITQIGSAQSNEAYIKKLNINDLITWNAILRGADNNMRIYDLSGMATTPQNKKEEGIRRYKLKWSDRVITYGSYTKIYKNHLHAFLLFLSKTLNVCT